MTSTDLAARYGAPSRARRRVLLGVVAAVAVVFLGWLAWSAVSHSTPEVRSELVAYDVIDEHSASATVRVVLRDDGVEASCLLRATAEDHTVVGELSFAVTGDDVAGGTLLTREVRTERLATSVELVGCTTPGQGRPR